MADLILQKSSAFAGCDLPANIGSTHLEAVEIAGISAIMPFKGHAIAVANVMKKTVKSTLPKVGEVSDIDGVQLVWFAQNHWLMFSNDAETANRTKDALVGMAAFTDQSGGWAVMSLSGDATLDVLARLCPLDFATLSVGQVARSEFAHVAAMIIPRKAGYWIAVPRSYAQAVVESTTEAMKSIAAQALI